MAGNRTKKAAGEEPARTPDQTEGAAEQPAITPQEYSAFIEQIELDDVWIAEAHAVNHYGPRTPDRAGIRVDAQASWEAQPAGFRAFHRHQIVFETPDTVLAEIQVTFGAAYSSHQPMSDDIFEIFGAVNLPLNTWPYVREYVAATLGRFGWTPFTLPVLKTTTGNAAPRRTGGRSGQGRASRPAGSESGRRRDAGAQPASGDAATTSEHMGLIP